ncbi:universal stress protein [Leptobacterium flavescens]|uniref:Universal stress protein n=1 Tax=Leptobacterium flavescens TaxID=472055 RepID=A0A6P0UN77_9FLAO|nr:universal stress protein [Leptobacterium flavescens]NER13962.1 universal stress protein [Leptobacterium flavescens]
MKKIIVPVDFSEHSEYALELAAQLARKHDAEIIALHMLEISESLLNKAEGQGYNEALFFMKMAAKRFEDFLDKEYLKGLKVTDIVQHHKVFTEVNETALKHNADLIIMGSHGTGGIKELFMGSNAEKVVRTAQLPVLVVKNRMPDFNIKKVVFAMDFHIENAEAYVRAMNLFKELNAEVELLYVNLPNDNFKSSDEIEDIIASFLQRMEGNSAKMEDVAIRNDYFVEKGVFNYSNKVKADLIAIPTHGRKGLSHFFLGSIGEDIVNHASIPVITFKM